ncbi:MAG: MFS transporter, partial [Actinopolymorphaceae bacterium]
MRDEVQVRFGRLWQAVADTAGAPRFLVAVVVFVGLVVAAVGSLGAPLITAVAGHYRVSLAAAQWTLTIALLSGAIATPLLGRFGSGPRRRTVVLAALAVAVAGSVLTVIPLPFPLLLLGRAAQGAGLGLTPLMMATARDHLDERRAAGTIALLSVASIAGIGVGYPLAGLLTDLAGLRAAYALGLGVTAVALVAAVVVLPPAPARAANRVDLRGAVLLTVALLALLIVISQTDLWRHHTALAAAILAVSLLLLAAWTILEARTDKPLVDVRLLRHPAVAAANLAML